jgi:hypothetical protein
MFSVDRKSKMVVIAASGQWFSQGITVSSINKTGSHDTTEILLKVVLNTINLSLR